MLNFCSFQLFFKPLAKSTYLLSQILRPVRPLWRNYPTLTPCPPTGGMFRLARFFDLVGGQINNFEIQDKHILQNIDLVGLHFFYKRRINIDQQLLINGIDMH